LRKAKATPISLQTEVMMNITVLLSISFTNECLIYKSCTILFLKLKKNEEYQK